MESERKSGYKVLRTRVARSMVIEQDLLGAKQDLERDAERLRQIQDYGYRAARARGLEELGTITAEAVARVFDLECGGVLLKNSGDGRLSLLATCGLWSHAQSIAQSLWAEASFPRRCRERGVFIEEISPGQRPWDEAGFAWIVGCPFQGIGGGTAGIVFGGVSLEKLAFYGKPTGELIPPFLVFEEQMSAILQNYEQRLLIRRQLLMLRKTNRRLAARTERLKEARVRLDETNHRLEQTLSSLTGLYQTGIELTAIGNVDRALDTVLLKLVQEFGYREAVVLLAEEEDGTIRFRKSARPRPDLGERLRNLPFSPADPLARRIAAASKALLVDDANVARFPPPVAALKEALQAESIVIAPLRVEQKLIGLLLVETPDARAGLRDEEAQILGTIADRLAASIEHSNLIAKIAATERLAALGEMASGIAHEIRNPLSAISTLIDLVRNQTRGGDPVLFAGITEEIRRLEQITGALLSYAQPYQPARVPTSIKGLLQEVVGLVGQDGRCAGKRIEADLGESGVEAALDRDAVRQVFWNVLLNALDATPAESAVTVRAAERDNDVTIAVADVGPGIAEADLPRIFEPFFTTKQSGTGLGLPIARKIVQAHGGTITVKSGVPRGTCVTITLPKG